jgi:hypothetical protein
MGLFFGKKIKRKLERVWWVYGSPTSSPRSAKELDMIQGTNYITYITIYNPPKMTYLDI